jgi:phosphatidylglycerol:prolipoprotein diacylglycerol transferase
MLLVGLELAGASLDVAGCFLALWLPLTAGIQRLGCLVGGCCFGRPSGKGIRYPAVVFARFSKRRRYRPDPDPGTAVFPLQLVESAFNLGFFILVLGAFRPSSGFGILLLYLALFYALRSINDRFRSRAKEARLGPFSATDLLALAFCCAALAYWHAKHFY